MKITSNSSNFSKATEQTLKVGQQRPERLISVRTDIFTYFLSCLQQRWLTSRNGIGRCHDFFKEKKTNGNDYHKLLTRLLCVTWMSHWQNGRKQTKPPKTDRVEAGEKELNCPREGKDPSTKRWRHRQSNTSCVYWPSPKDISGMGRFCCPCIYLDTNPPGS